MQGVPQARRFIVLGPQTRSDMQTRLQLKRNRTERAAAVSVARHGDIFKLLDNDVVWRELRGYLPVATQLVLRGASRRFLERWEPPRLFAQQLISNMEKEELRYTVDLSRLLTRALSQRQVTGALIDRLIVDCSHSVFGTIGYAMDLTIRPRFLRVLLDDSRNSPNEWGTTFHVYRRSFASEEVCITLITYLLQSEEHDESLLTAALRLSCYEHYPTAARMLLEDGRANICVINFTESLTDVAAVRRLILDDWCLPMYALNDMMHRAVRDRKPEFVADVAAAVNSRPMISSVNFYVDILLSTLKAFNIDRGFAQIFHILVAHAPKAALPQVLAASTRHSKNTMQLLLTHTTRESLPDISAAVSRAIRFRSEELLRILISDERCNAAETLLQAVRARMSFGYILHHPGLTAEGLATAVQMVEYPYDDIENLWADERLAAKDYTASFCKVIAKGVTIRPPRDLVAGKAVDTALSERLVLQSPSAVKVLLSVASAAAVNAALDRDPSNTSSHLLLLSHPHTELARRNRWFVEAAGKDSTPPFALSTLASMVSGQAIDTALEVVSFDSDTVQLLIPHASPLALDSALVRLANVYSSSSSSLPATLPATLPAKVVTALEQLMIQGQRSEAAVNFACQRLRRPLM